jgi:NAD(P)-dependent dehydrogenase (short-subunit alcohol dehydrogenase family)
MSIKGKVALVTGGTKGIGRAIAEQLSDAGAKVIVVARTAPVSMDQDQYFIQADVSEPGSGSFIAQEVLSKYGRIDIIINNAGANLSPGGGFSTLSDEDWSNDWQLNFMSAVRINKALLPAMIRQGGGVIIHISTGAAKVPVWEMTMSYSASKAALNVYSKALANELGSKGIRVNVVSPGLVKTPLLLDYLDNLATSGNMAVSDLHQSVLSRLGVQLGRLAEPGEVAGLVMFLASDEAKYITGVNYPVDGGALPTV